jgi:hypothetical protein
LLEHTTKKSGSYTLDVKDAFQRIILCSEEEKTELCLEKLEELNAFRRRTRTELR